MEYEAFVRQFLSELQQNIELQGVDVDLQRQETNKYNGVVKDGFTVRYLDAKIGLVEYLDDLYEMHKDGYSISELVDIVTEKFEMAKENVPEIPVLTAESAKENLYCTVVNTADNEEMLKNVPHEKLEDLSVVARFRVGKDGSFLVTNDICKTLQMTSEEVMEAAHANTDRAEYKCQSMGEVMRELMIHDGMPDDYTDELIQMQGEQCPMWILSNESRVDGAVAITSQETLKAAHEKLGEDFYVLPSSRHEVILVPQSMVSDVEDLKKMVHEVNATEVSKIDKLSDSVYLFNGRHLSIADTPTEKLGETLTDGLSKGHSHSH